MKTGKIKLEKLTLQSFVTETEVVDQQTIVGGVLHQNPSVTDCGSVFCPTNVVLLCPSALHCPDC